MVAALRDDFENYKYLNLYSLGKGTMGTGTFQNCFRGEGTLILWETGHSILHGNDFFLWESDHLSSWIRDILWVTGHGNGTRYPLGFGPIILWETSSSNWEFGR